MAAQEKLKDESVQGTAGGGAVKVTMSGDLQVKEIYIDPSAIDPEDPELLSDMVTAAVNEAIRAAQELANAKMGAVTGGLGADRAAGSAAWACPASRVLPVYAPPVQRLITELGKLPGIGARTAQRLAFHILRAEDAEALALADAIREVTEKVGLCEVCFNPRRGAALRDLPGPAP